LIFSWLVSCPTLGTIGRLLDCKRLLRESVSGYHLIQLEREGEVPRFMGSLNFAQLPNTLAVVDFGMQ
jgi:hypothetical protein